MSAGRYRACAELVAYDAAGRPVRYLAPRILPQGASVASGARASVQADELHRLDLVAHRLLGQSGQAWRIADANDAMDPFALCARAGIQLSVPRSTL